MVERLMVEVSRVVDAVTPRPILELLADRCRYLALKSTSGGYLVLSLCITQRRVLTTIIAPAFLPTRDRRLQSQALIRANR